MSLLLGLGLGFGLLLIYASFWPRPSTAGRPNRPRRRRLRKLLDEAGHPRIPVTGVLTAVLVCAVAAFLVVLVLTAAVPVALCFAFFAGMVPVLALRWQAGKRRALLRHIWPDAVDHLRSAVRSGMSLPEGLIQLGTSGPEPLREPFVEFAKDYRAGQTLGVALERLKLRLADPVGDRIVAALLITREVGGSDLGRLLSTLAEFLRENARTRSELEARQSWTVNAAKLAVAAPWIVVLLLSLQRDAAEAYRGATGMLVLGAGLLVSLVCYRLMLRIGALPREVRVLA
ncbi:type II secretion system F family protein [Nesterenkonia sp. LB17]|uniref:type II secretion system F family protein n=1 Tax=unclassified Nesterenkonia TaxID=2629769 RepID=UPI001F4C89B3|nr:MULTISPECIES: type II secretion system F family protein [unclassified Nesterenkonia]MCH8561760.1 type II secretion system F family protein [Nesterenkonia sp. YGD6]MCH8564711.1 type II secretion system F family protein [Nesterenkonia sp. LB17]MCH8570331.1 type II secretion system F family protein [Nesterenkonia sp. AY15]